jgi:Polyketide cyclase / dehydrase and lipid transport
MYRLVQQPETGGKVMGRKVTFSVTAWSPASSAVVYGLLCSGATWPRWSPLGSFRLEREGRDGGESLGAIRVFTTAGVHSREEMVGFEPGRSFSYSALSGLPIRDHRADVTLAERDGGTVIDWREDFRAKVPGTGWLQRLFLRRFVQRCADGLARHAARLADRPATAGR